MEAGRNISTDGGRSRPGRISGPAAAEASPVDRRAADLSTAPRRGPDRRPRCLHGGPDASEHRADRDRRYALGRDGTHADGADRADRQRCLVPERVRSELTVLSEPRRDHDRPILALDRRVDEQRRERRVRGVQEGAGIDPRDVAGRCRVPDGSVRKGHERIRIETRGHRSTRMGSMGRDDPATQLLQLRPERRWDCRPPRIRARGLLHRRARRLRGVVRERPLAGRALLHVVRTVRASLTVHSGPEVARRPSRRRVASWRKPTSRTSLPGYAL